MNRKRFPLLVLFPQAAPGRGWNPEVVIAEIDQTLRDFRVDASRIYLTGFSMGGAGVYDTAARWPEKFAAVIAIAGPVPRDTSELVRGLRRVSVRIMHGAKDGRVAADLQRAGGSVEYKEDPDNGHDGDKPYADPEMIEWLLGASSVSHRVEGGVCRAGLQWGAFWHFCSRGRVRARVRVDRGGHGIPPSVVIDEIGVAGLRHVRTIDKWPPDDRRPTYFLAVFTNP